MTDGAMTAGETLAKLATGLGVVPNVAAMAPVRLIASPGSPAESFQAPPEGALVDRWLLPRSNDGRTPASAGNGPHRH